MIMIIESSSASIQRKVHYVTVANLPALHCPIAPHGFVAYSSIYTTPISIYIYIYIYPTACGKPATVPMCK